MDKPSPMALFQDIPGLLLGYLTVVLRPPGDEHVAIQPDHYLNIHRVITVAEHGAAGARPQGQPLRTVHYLFGLRGGEQICLFHIPAIGVSNPPDQPAEHHLAWKM